MERKRVESDGVSDTARSIAKTWFIAGENAAAFKGCAHLGSKASLQAALASLTAWENWNRQRDLKDIEAATLILWGDRDRSYGWQQPAALWRGIRDSSLAVIPGCAHAVHLEKPDIFNAIVADFLEVS